MLKKNLIYLSTPFSLQAAKKLNEMGVKKATKIGSVNLITYL